jgi:fluoroquinolone resistance protein
MESLITRRCSFSECNFKAAHMNASLHESSAFTNCQFEYANFFSILFRECKMIGSSFVNVNMLGATINGGDWSYTNLRLNNLKGLDLRKTKFVRADLYRCDMEKTNLRYADLSYAILTQANLTGADLRDANTEGVDFKSFNLKGVYLDIAQSITVARAYGAIVE